MCAKQPSTAIGIKRTILWSAVATAAVAAGPAFAFECSKAGTATEKTICSDTELRRLDAQLNRDYKLFRKAFSGSGKHDCLLEDEAVAQKKWLKQRDACGSDRDCIAQAYRKRLDEIGLYSRICVAQDTSQIYEGRACHKTGPEVVTSPTAPVASATSPATSSSETECTEALRVDFSFTRGREGMMYDFYIPGVHSINLATGEVTGKRKGGKPIQRSGVTVDTGYDLGQQTVATVHEALVNELRDYSQNYQNITPATVASLESKFLPFIQRKKADAVSALDDAVRMKGGKYPNLTTEQAVFVTEAAKHAYIANAERAWNSGHPFQSFRKQPQGVQTVWVDIVYNGLGSVPKGVTAALKKGEYSKAADMMRKSTGTYADRNKKRADLLKPAKDGNPACA